VAKKRSKKKQKKLAYNKMWVIQEPNLTQITENSRVTRFQALHHIYQHKDGGQLVCHSKQHASKYLMK
jgi:hypothetical protein